MSPPLVINPDETAKSAGIISDVINRAEALRPGFYSEIPAKFNLPSTGQDYENQYILDRRNKKLQNMGVGLNSTISSNSSASSSSNTISNENKVKNQSNAFMNPIEQIQAQHTDQSNIDTTQSQFSNVDNPFGRSPSNVLGLKLAENPNLEEKDNEIIFESEIKH